MNQTADIVASPGRRKLFAVGAAIMLGLWGWSFLPPIENWGNPNEDGFSYGPLFYATIFCLPPGLLLLVGAVRGHGRSVRRARIALPLAAVITLFVALFLIVQHIANNNDGKVFGIQIGLQLGRDAGEGRETAAKTGNGIDNAGAADTPLHA